MQAEHVGVGVCFVCVCVFCGTPFWLKFTGLQKDYFLLVLFVFFGGGDKKCAHPLFKSQVVFSEGGTCTSDVRGRGIFTMVAGQELFSSEQFILKVSDSS